MAAIDVHFDRIIAARKIAKRAKSMGYAVSAKRGKIQFQILTPKGNGQFDIQHVTDWLTPDEANKLLDEAGIPCAS